MNNAWIGNLEKTMVAHSRTAWSRFQSIFIADALCLGVIALALRLAWIVLVPAEPFPGHDFDWYWDRACQLAQGGGYSMAGEPTAYWPVGYPAFLGIQIHIFGSDFVYAKVANALLGSAGVILIFLLARQWFQSRLIAWMASLFMAVYPNHIAYSSLMASEPLFLALALGAILALEREKWVWGGIGLGLATLVKAQAVLIPAAWFVARFMVADNRWAVVKGAIGVALLSGLVMLPWLVRNERVFGQPVFIATNGGGNLLVGNNPHATGGYIEFIPLVERLGIHGDNEAKLDAACAIYARQYIRQHPWKTILGWPSKIKLLFWGYTDGIRFNERSLVSPQPHWRTSLLWIAQKISALMGLFIVGSGLVGIGLAAFHRILHRAQAPHASLMPAVIMVGLASIHLAMFSDTRYQYPLFPFLAMYCAWLMVALHGCCFRFVKATT